MDRNQVFQLLVDCTCAVIPELSQYSFAPSDSLQQLGATSVDRAEIITMTLDSLSLRIPRVDTFGPSNLGELADLLYEKLQRA